jgi:hypothetical protein
VPVSCGYMILRSPARDALKRVQAPVAERQLRSRLQGQEVAVSNAPELFKASRYRRAAATCGILAASATSLSDCEALLRMQRSWLDRARREDWLDDLPPNSPVSSNALAMRRLS